MAFWIACVLYTFFWALGSLYIKQHLALGAWGYNSSHSVLCWLNFPAHLINIITQPTRQNKSSFIFCPMNRFRHLNSIQTHTVRCARFVIWGLGTTRHCPARKWSATFEIGMQIELHRFIALLVCSDFEITLESPGTCKARALALVGWSSIDAILSVALSHCTLCFNWTWFADHFRTHVYESVDITFCGWTWTPRKRNSRDFRFEMWRSIFRPFFWLGTKY